MVGYDPQRDGLMPKYGHSVAGAASGMITRAITQPLDVLKVRFQLQVEPLSRNKSSKYYGILQASSTMWKEEGVTAFWKGHLPAQMLSLVYGIIQFGSFEFFTQKVWIYLPSYFTTDMKPVTHFVCGGLSGCAATLGCQPFDVLRTRFVAQTEPKLYQSLVHGVRHIWMHEGIKGLYKGLLPTLIQIAPQTGFQFGFYSFFSSSWKYVSNTQEQKTEGVLQSLLCGSGAGLCAKLVVYPLDTIKKRLQIQGFENGRVGFGKNRQYKGLVNCLQVMFKEESFRGLYKGLKPSLLKSMLAVGLNFCVYEQCCHLIIALYPAR